MAEIVQVSKKNFLLSLFKGFLISILVSICSTGLIFLSIYATSYFENNIFQNFYSFILFLMLFIILIPFSAVYIYKKLFNSKYLISVPFSFILGL